MAQLPWKRHEFTANTFLSENNLHSRYTTLNEMFKATQIKNSMLRFRFCFCFRFRLCDFTGLVSKRSSQQVDQTCTKCLKLLKSSKWQNILITWVWKGQNVFFRRSTILKSVKTRKRFSKSCPLRFHWKQLTSYFLCP